MCSHAVIWLRYIPLHLAIFISVLGQVLFSAFFSLSSIYIFVHKYRVVIHKYLQTLEQEWCNQLNIKWKITARKKTKKINKFRSWEIWLEKMTLVLILRACLERVGSFRIGLLISIRIQHWTLKNISRCLFG